MGKPVLHKEFGTLIQWGSLRFSKAVKCLLEICQKTISYNNVSENSHKYVRIVSENYQKQISVKTVSEKIWKYVRNVSDFYKCLRKLPVSVLISIGNLSISRTLLYRHPPRTVTQYKCMVKRFLESQTTFLIVKYIWLQVHSINTMTL